MVIAAGGTLRSGDELYGERDGDVETGRGNQRGGGEQHVHNGHNSSGRRWCGDNDRITVNRQSGSLTNGFTYVGQPTVTSVSPGQRARRQASTEVPTITGTNFASFAAATLPDLAARRSMWWW